MKHIDMMKKAYQWYLDRYSKRENPNLDWGSEFHEVLLSCMCGARWIMDINSSSPTPDLSSVENLRCDNCKKTFKDGVVTISGHSGDVFNATLMRGKQNA